MDTIQPQPRTLFDLFPTEVILLIFNYLSNNEIIFTFFFFNQRFNDLLLENKCYINHLELPRTNLHFWQNILSIIGSQIKSLNITLVDISLPLTYFPKLESFIISSRHGFRNEELRTIFNSNLFQNLHSSQVKEIQVFDYEVYEFYSDIISEDYVLENVFNNENSLETFEYLLDTSPLKIKNTTNLQTNFNLHSLTLILTDFKDTYMYTLLSYTPNLQCLYLRTEAPYHLQTPMTIIDIKLKKLSLELNRKQRYETPDTYWFENVDVNQLISFIKQFSSSLIYLSLDLLGIGLENANDFPFNSNKLQQLLEAMIKLQQFHLIAHADANEIDHDDIISTFKNELWFDHNWSFGMYRNYFFTLPFHFDYFNI
jgi:hypothetical protein